jgi:hypothetical protein
MAGGTPALHKMLGGKILSSAPPRLCGIATLRLHQAGLDEAFFGLGA